MQISHCETENSSLRFVKYIKRKSGRCRVIRSCLWNGTIILYEFIFVFKEKCIFAMFCSVLISGSAKSRMKRELGESPGQSRCCKLQTFTFVYPLQGHCLLNEDGKARQTGVSQKTCKTKSCLHSRGKDGKNVRNVELQLKFE